MSNLSFRAMAFTFRIRDFLKSRGKIVKEAGIEAGFHVLDYGCGPGSYIKPVAELVGMSGKIYALDVQPIALEMVKKIAEKNRLPNVTTILSDCKTGLPESSIDVALLYDVFHDVTDRDCVLGELHRVLKVDGILSVSDHHMIEDEILSDLTRNELFSLTRRGRETYSFFKAEHK